MSLLSGTDTIYALRFLRLLTMKWEETEAYKVGVVDENGKKIKDPKTKEEKEAYTLFHRLVFNVRRLMPRNRIANYAAAIFLVREHTGLSKDNILAILEAEGVDTNEELREDFFIKEDKLLQGDYTLKESIASPTTGEVIARKGTKVQVKESLEPVDRIGGVHIYEVTHIPTRQKIYVSQEDIKR